MLTSPGYASRAKASETSRSHCFTSVSRCSWRNDWYPSGGYFKLHFLLRSVLRRPHLASHIRHIQLSGPYPRRIRPGWTNKATRKLAHVDMKLIHQCVMDTGIDQPDEWMKATLKASLDALMALLLSMVPNIRTLDLEMAQYERWPFS